MEANLICFNCKHLFEDGFGCKAFPEGIPFEITEGGLKHDEPLEDQNNKIVFEPKANEGL